MLKKYFLDGLLQVAIVLSLLRSDWNNYLNSIQQEDIPQEIILGPLSGYTSTSIHNHWLNGNGLLTHPKSYDTDQYYSNSVFRELHNLGQYSDRFRVNHDIDAYLVNHPETVTLPSEGADTSNNNDQADSGQEGPNDSDNNNNDDFSAASSRSEIVIPSPEADGGIVNDFRANQLNFNFPDGELTKEDLDLIDVLWRQDIDLGVGRECFDVTLRQELEKEKEIALKKEKDEEQYDQKKPTDEEDNSDTTTYIIDGETGELVPATDNVGQFQGLSTVTPLEPVTLGEEEGLSVEEAMRLLESNTRQNSVVPQGSLPQPISIPTGLVSDNGTFQLDIETMIQNAANFQTNHDQLQPQPFMRQASFEQRWQDVASILELQPPGAVNVNSGHYTGLVSGDVNMSVPQQAILNNASLATVAPHHNNSFASDLSAAINIGADQRPVYPQASNLSGGMGNTTSLMPPFNNTSLGLDGMHNGSFINSSETLLQQLLSDDIHGIDFNDLNITGGVQQPMQTDDTASDSAISSMSNGSPQTTSGSPQVLLELQSNISSPYDGLVGATGGSESPGPKYAPTKYEKFDPDYSYTDQSMDSDGGFGNFSSSSNDTEFRAPTTVDANPRQVAHNHTYPLQPGQTPKERKSARLKAEENEAEENRIRDVRKAQALKLPFTVDDIIHAPVELFNDMLQKHTLSEPQLQLVRDIRRRGKNKVAAQNCRKRKMEVIQQLEDEVEQMRRQRDRLANQRRLITKEARDMRDKYDSMYAEVFRSLRDEDGQPYDPDQYSLQQTADGNVFLVPRNSTSVQDDPKEKGTRKRKASRKDR